MSGLRSKRTTLYVLTFLVAFCSFAYELVYSELLTVIYGGTVVRYAITIGLYFSALGLGSRLARYLDTESWKNFFRMELYLAFSAPAGFLYIILLNSVSLTSMVPPEPWATISAHVPIVVVGFLSGLELPFLTAMIESLDDSDTSTISLARVRDVVGNANQRVLGSMFAISEPRESDESFSSVLTLDYIGGLVGSVGYALVLYPRLGLIPTIFALSILNAIVALVFWAQFARSPDEPIVSKSRNITFGKPSRVLVAACVLLTAGYAGALAYHSSVNSELTKAYLGSQIEQEYPSGNMDVAITDYQNTKYQDIVMYNRTWEGKKSNWYGPNQTERCLRLDRAIQMCDSWADSYHNGLVDVPMSMYSNNSTEDMDVLLVGGGDWVAINHLRQYNVSVDQLDIDGEFMQYTKNRSFFEDHHNNSYEYDKLNTTKADAYTYLRTHEKKYDMILLDIPGLRDDKLLKLYSKEFYTMLSRSLDQDGVVVTWKYSRYAAPEHHEIFTNTLRAGGFTHYFPYASHDDLDHDGDEERVERFYMLSKGAQPELPVEGDGVHPYVENHSQQYGNRTWHQLPTYRGVDVNSIFNPNYDVIVHYGED